MLFLISLLAGYFDLSPIDPYGLARGFVFSLHLNDSLSRREFNEGSYLGSRVGMLYVLVEGIEDCEEDWRVENFFVGDLLPKDPGL